MPGSKRLSREEKSLAHKELSPYKVGVEAGYPFLQEKGKELVLSGVRFHDLSQVFKNHHETLYSDDCCHVNDAGSAILGQAIGTLTVEDLEGQ